MSADSSYLHPSLTLEPDYFPHKERKECERTLLRDRERRNKRKDRKGSRELRFKRKECSFMLDKLQT